MDNLMFSILEWCVTIFFCVGLLAFTAVLLKLTWEILTTRE